MKQIFFSQKNLSITKISTGMCKIQFISSFDKIFSIEGYTALKMFTCRRKLSEQFPKAPTTHTTQSIVPCKALYLDEFSLLFGIIPEHVQQTLPGDGS